MESNLRILVILCPAQASFATKMVALPKSGVFRKRTTIRLRTVFTSLRCLRLVLTFNTKCNGKNRLLSTHERKSARTGAGWSACIHFSGCPHPGRAVSSMDQSPRAGTRRPMKWSCPLLPATSGQNCSKPGISSICCGLQWIIFL